jgi:hypothetical protein
MNNAVNAWADMSSGCWLWLGSVSEAGYGRYGSKLAHRLVYQQYVGTIADGYEIDHLCRNRGCVNPSHLEQVTHKENMDRANLTSCRSGHVRTANNTKVYLNKDGYIRRHCKECQVIRKLHNKEVTK